jgi:hypothetical protein
MSPISIIVWTCVALFVTTSVITVLALLGIVVLGGSTKSNHSYYLKRLFVSLILEVVSSGAAIFYQQTKSVQIAELPDQFVQLQRRVDDLERTVSSLPRSAPTGHPVRPSSHWELTRMGSDCAGRDIASTPTPTPDPAQCKPGVTAVCWDGQLFRNGIGSWCTYKAVEPQACTGGGAPGRLYSCKSSEG